jgi:hypothetical protein
MPPLLLSRRAVRRERSKALLRHFVDTESPRVVAAFIRDGPTPGELIHWKVWWENEVGEPLTKHDLRELALMREQEAVIAALDEERDPEALIRGFRNSISPDPVKEVGRTARSE